MMGRKLSTWYSALILSSKTTVTDLSPGSDARGITHDSSVAIIVIFSGISS